MSSKFYLFGGMLLVGLALATMMPRREGEDSLSPLQRRPLASSTRKGEVHFRGRNEDSGKEGRTSELEVESPRSVYTGETGKPPAKKPDMRKSITSALPGIARLPLVFRREDDELLRLIPGIPEDGLAGLREAFVRETGAGELDPSDPVYEQRWQEAEASLEERIRSLYGWGAWAAYQRELALDAYAANGRR